jgi:methylthioribose-1-phosphate isomerase
MNVGGKLMRTIGLAADGWAVEVIDQTRLPHELRIVRLETAADAAAAIADMVVRGAPLIGAAAAYGLCLALRADPGTTSLARASAALAATRPTAVNLRAALEHVTAAVAALPASERAAAAYRCAAAFCDEEAALAAALGQHGRPLLAAAFRAAGGQRPVQVLTHCNAGWLATVDFGTALAPVYAAHDAGLPVHVWVDETRPRNQGAALTAWELGEHGVPHTVIADNAGGHLMQRGRVDLCLVGADCVTASGDVCNKIGTYLKALAAREHAVPFYAVFPHTTLDWTIADGVSEIPIEERSADEVRRVRGRGDDGRIVAVTVVPPGSPVANPAFDVTPARLLTGLVTERGVCAASAAGLQRLYPERAG